MTVGGKKNKTWIAADQSMPLSVKNLIIGEQENCCDSVYRMMSGHIEVSYHKQKTGRAVHPNAGSVE